MKGAKNRAGEEGGEKGIYSGGRRGDLTNSEKKSPLTSLNRGTTLLEEENRNQLRGGGREKSDMSDRLLVLRALLVVIVPPQGKKERTICSKPHYQQQKATGVGGSQRGKNILASKKFRGPKRKQ